MVFKGHKEDRFEQGKHLSDRFFSFIPVGELKPDETFIRGVRHYPTPVLKFMPWVLLKSMLFFSQFRSHEFFIGQFSAHKDYHLSLDPRALFSRDFAIIGQTGFGKSWTVTRLIRQLCRGN